MKWVYVGYFAFNLVMALIAFGANASKKRTDAAGLNVISVLLFVLLGAGILVFWP